MKFIKMHGAGNDYIYVNGFLETIENPEQVAISISDRHFGVGGDGLVLILPSNAADFRMQMFNADGSEGKMCGNAIRCVGKFVYDGGMTTKTDISIETLSGIKHVSLKIVGGSAVSARVNMGKPEFVPSLIPVLCDCETAFDFPINVHSKLLPERTFFVNCVSMGNPHAVIFLLDDEELSDELVLGYGPLIEKHPAFPDRINVEFVKVIDESTLRMRVFERGSGETLACGTGACAVAVTAKTKGIVSSESKIDVLLIGGTLQIEYLEDGTVYMTGPAVKVFEGEIEI